MLLILLALACAAAGLVGRPWLNRFILRRYAPSATPSQRFWLSLPVVAGGSALAALLWLIEGPVELRIGLILSGLFAWSLVCTDLAIHKLPNPLVAAHAAIIAGTFTFLLLVEQADQQLILRALLGGVAGFGLFFALALLGRRSMGFGDVKLAGGLGILTGAFGATTFIQWVILSFLFGGLVAVLLLATRRMRPKDSIAFGPWLILGAYLAVAVTGLA